MERYALIHDKLPREFVLLQGTGCKWGRCLFCDYHTDVSSDPFEVNRPILEQVTGQYGVLDVINSGSAFELDDQTIALLQHVIQEKHIHTLWFEMHWMYRNRLEEFKSRILSGLNNAQSVTSNSLPNIKFRCGIETFDSDLRKQWNKGVSADVTVVDVARYFQGVCLLCCTEGETRERILRDIELARQYFEYFSVNLFCNNTTSIKRNPALVSWFLHEVYPKIQNDPHIEILINNNDLGVG